MEEVTTAASRTAREEKTGLRPPSADAASSAWTGAAPPLSLFERVVREAAGERPGPGR